MVTGVLNDSKNQPTKRLKQQRAPSESARQSLNIQNFVHATTANLSNHQPVPIPKALKASLPFFDRKSEKFELFEVSFRNNIKMYPHLTEIQEIQNFQSLLRGNALQAYCNLDDTEKDDLEEDIRHSNVVPGTSNPPQKKVASGTLCISIHITKIARYS